MTQPPPLPPEVRAFLGAHIGSVSQLELLLLVHDQPGLRGVDELAAEFYLAPSAFQPWLTAFAAQGLLREQGGLFGPPPPEEPVTQLVAQVADTYARRRVTVSRYVYASRDDPVQRFADAFLLRKDKDL